MNELCLFNECLKVNLKTALEFGKVVGIEENYLDVVGNTKSRKNVLEIDSYNWRMKMTNDLKSVLPTPTKRRFAATFRLVRPISFWVQLALGFIPHSAPQLSHGVRRRRPCMKHADEARDFKYECLSGTLNRPGAIA